MLLEKKIVKINYAIKIETIRKKIRKHRLPAFSIDNNDCCSERKVDDRRERSRNSCVFNNEAHGRFECVTSLAAEPWDSHRILRGEKNQIKSNKKCTTKKIWRRFEEGPKRK